MTSVAARPGAGTFAAQGPWWRDRLILWAIGLTLGLLVVRLFVIGRFGLFFDEAYYWMWSTRLSAGYYDHPPMVAYFIRLGTLLFGDTEYGVRFVGAVSLAVDVALISALAQTIYGDRRTAAWAAILANLTLLAIVSIISVPDQPMLTFWLAAMVALARVAQGRSPLWWLVAGAMFGLSAASKYTAFFLLAGVPLWLLVVPGLRRWFVRPWPYLALLVGVAVFSPVLVWNSDNGWASFVLQYSRPAYETASFGSLLTYIVLVPLVVTPPIFLLAVIGARRAAQGPSQRAQALLLAIPVPLAVFFAYHSLGEEIGFHWLSPFAAIGPVLAASVLTSESTRAIRWLRNASVGVGFVLTGAVYFLLVQNLFAVPPRYDYTARFRGWPEFVANVEALRISVGADYVVGTEYFMRGYFDFYLDDPPPAFHLGEWNRWTGFPAADPALAGSRALFIGMSSQRVERASAERFFTEVEYLGSVARPIGGGLAVGSRAFVVSGPRPGTMALFSNWQAPLP
jgi:4-amino-4-deoxy-L-arabinose transferase-like glycosyltransferase